jgi:cullin 1
MLTLLSRIKNGINPMLDIFENYVTRLGKDYVASFLTSQKDPKDYVDSLHALYTQFTQLRLEVFAQESQFKASLDKAFRSILNDRSEEVKSAELLARYGDIFLKKNAKSNLSEQEIDVKLSNMTALFRFIDQKDVFQQKYSKAMAKRMIYNTGLSDDIEQGMISRLRDICGAEYANKLARMVTDIELSNDLNVQFKDFMGSHSLDMDLNVRVLQFGPWPLSKATENLSLIPLFEQSVDKFNQFYVDRYNGRKLNWLHYLSRGIFYS